MVALAAEGVESMNAGFRRDHKYLEQCKSLCAVEMKAWVGAGDLCRRVLAGSISRLSWDMLFASLCCLALTCPE